MNKISLIRSCLKKEKSILLKSLQKAKDVRDSAPSAAQSWSDTTRNQAEKLVGALEEKLQNLEKIDLSIPSETDSEKDNKVYLWSYVEVKLNNQLMKIIFVPEGVGGKEIKGIKLISSGSPLGEKLIGKVLKEQFVFNNRTGKILNIN